MTPLRPVWISFGSLTALERKVVRPPCAARYARRLAPSRSETIPAGKPRSTAMKFASPKRLSTSRIPVAPALRTRSIFETNVQPPRETSATVPLSEPAGSEVKRESFGSKPGGEQTWRSTGWPFVPVIVPTSTSVCPAIQAGATRALNEYGTCCRLAGAPGPVTVSSVPKTCRFETAATEIAAGALLGEPTEPRPKSSRSFPAEITGTTPAAATLFERVDQRVARRVDLGPAAGEVDHVHAVVHGRLEGEHDLRREGVEPAGRHRHVEDAVVADPRARRDPGEAGDRRMVGPGGDDRAGHARCDPGDVRAVERVLPVRARGGPAARSRGRGRRARRSPSASSTSCRPSGSRPGTRSRPG